MAGDALDACVLAGEDECDSRMVEVLRAEPVLLDSVAARAVGAELAEVDVLVAVDAGRRQVSVPAGGHHTLGIGGLEGVTVALCAVIGCMFAAEELLIFRVLERGKAEGPGAVTARADRAELSLVDIGVTGHADPGKTAVVESRNDLGPRRGLFLVACNAGDLGVTLVERELGPRTVVECCSPETVHRVAGGTVLAEGPQMRVRMTVAASLEAELGGRGVPRAVALGAGDRRVLPVQGKTGLRVVHRRGRPALGRVTRSAGGAEQRLVRIPVAVAALGKLQALVLAIAVARHALHCLVGADEGVGGCVVIEGEAGVSEGGRGGVAADAPDAERTFVDILVTRGAVRCQLQVGPRFVALRAVLRDFFVETVEGETGLLEMVEVSLVQGADIGIAARVLHVAGDAVVADIAMHAAF